MHVFERDRWGRVGKRERELYIQNSVTKGKDHVLIFIYNSYFQKEFEARNI